MQTVGGVQLDERAEVGLLTRVITIQGDSASLTTGIGGHVMVMQGATAHVEGVTFTAHGPEGAPGALPDALAHGGRGGRTVFPQQLGMEDASIAASPCTAPTTWSPTATSATITSGHGFFLEDGAESGNTFTNNLVHDDACTGLG